MQFLSVRTELLTLVSIIARDSVGFLLVAHTTQSVELTGAQICSWRKHRKKKHSRQESEELIFFFFSTFCTLAEMLTEIS